MAAIKRLHVELPTAALVPPRKPITEATWYISAELVRNDGTVLERTDAPLELSDAWVVKHLKDAGANVVRWLDSFARSRSLAEERAKRSAKKRTAARTGKKS